MMKVGISPSMFRKRQTINRSTRQSGGTIKIIFKCLFGGIIVLFIAYVVFLLNFDYSKTTTYQQEQQQRQQPKSRNNDNDGNINDMTRQQRKEQAQEPNEEEVVIVTPGKNCIFRKYPPHRYYKLNEDWPDFLLAETIFGEPPILLQPAQTKGPAQKLCVDQSEWYTDQNKLPFADGTNPSIISLRHNTQISSSIVDLFPSDATFLATLCMTNSQCAWNDSPQEQEKYKISSQDKPSTVRTIFLVLNEHFETLMQSTIYLQLNANWGRKVKPKKDSTGNFVLQPFAFDDARLFTNNGQLWMSYREGPGFGYDKQVLNELHITIDDYNNNNNNNNGGNKKMSVMAIASETVTFCCGRNMALMDNVESHKLQSLSWVDPITVIDVDDGRSPSSPHKRKGRRQRRRLLTQYYYYHESNSEGKQYHQFEKKRIKESKKSQHDDNIQQQTIDSKGEFQRRKLKDNGKKKSDFHGTNAFMVYLPKTHEFLGVGHFHRPPGRAANDYARFGHHYTHSFFTIPASPPFRLKRLSPEFLLPSYSYPNDGEIIQFMSGLERVVDGDEEHIVIAYGINDCEGAAIYLDMDTVEKFLREVPTGQEVVDTMTMVKKYP